MKRVWIAAAALQCIFGCATLCTAYETETHALITRQAYANSVLANTPVGATPVTQILGLDRLNALTPFNDYWLGIFSVYYIDGGKIGVTTQGGNTVFLPGSYGRPEEFERCQMDELLLSSFGPKFIDTVSTFDELPEIDPLLPIQNWLVRGAIREDDLGSSAVGIITARGANCGAKWLDTRANQPNGFYLRSYNHFYDPWLDIGLTVTVKGVPISGYKSVNWAMGYVDSFANPPQVDPNRGNTFSYIDARNTFFWALTRELNKHAGQPYTAAQRQIDALDRLYLWATTFRSLGNVVHLLEDTGQPQHTRNDPHSATNSDEQQAFEGYTNSRVLGSAGPDNAQVGSYVKGFFPGQTVPLLAPPLGDYWEKSNVMFATPSRFFTTRGDNPHPASRAGLADYTNRGFFTGGTLPGTAAASSEAFPDPNLSLGYTIEMVPCEGLQSGPAVMQSIKCKHWEMVPPDVVNSSYVDKLPKNYSLPPLVSESILNQIVQAQGSQSPPRVALGIGELDTMGNMTIPRAVGYATGMINYFFRGVGGIKITPPSSGVYAILDHGQPHTKNAQGYPCQGTDTSDGCAIFGFIHVQMNVQNTTAPIVESGSGPAVPQNLTNGTLVAVARYHRNTCYMPDLSGEASVDANALWSGASLPVAYPSTCSTNTAYIAGRSPYPEISVSAKIPVSGDGKISMDGQFLDINGNSPILAKFEFPDDPIPVNATDLSFEVVFQGIMGDTSGPDPNRYEANAVAVGSIDVSEPTYETFMNLSSFYYSWGTAYPPFNGWSVQGPGPYTPDNIPEPATDSLNICFGDRVLASVNGRSSTTTIAPGGAFRLAMIFDKDAPANANLIVNYPTVCSIYNEDGSCAGAETAWGIMGSVDTWIYSSMAALSPSQIDAFHHFVLHVAQSDMENNADSQHGYQFLPVIAGAGVSWGDNFYYSYGRNVGNGQNTSLMTTPFPPTALAGATGGVMATPLPTEPSLTTVDTFPFKCPLNGPWTVPYW